MARPERPGHGQSWHTSHRGTRPGRRPLIAEIHADLLALLASLRDTEWAAPTEAGRWTVKDVALHLLDGDLSQLSMGRDGKCP